MESDGSMWLSCDDSSPIAANEKEDCSLVRMPSELLLPLDGISWEERSDRLVLITSPDRLSPVQCELLDLHIELYNATGKLPWFLLNHPDVLLQESPSILSAVGRLRPGKKVAWTTHAAAFLKTRMCKFRPTPKNVLEALEGEMSQESQGIVPIIDLLNNKYDAPRFAFYDHGGISVRVDPLRASSECFAHYYKGRHDVLDLALGSGYLDQNTPFAHSAPVEVRVPGYGSLAVEGVTANKPTHLLDPPRVQFTDAGLSLSHLTCNIHKPQGLRVALALALQGAFRGKGLQGSAAVEPIPIAGFLEALVEANQALLADLEQAAAPLTEQWPSADLLIRACRRQADLFEKGMAVVQSA
ncbi:hypothetical protein KQ306_09965 [Synechococcus sp. CS-1324]|uniref:hypothetical protein n=1 Tax=Synechococcus sp. CS-1324 TaxID=2847980 RepID=UPI00223AD220|nr:hypothetical protein [Synechococcus sp. CS-1324]MCT0231172.1 hypothetical protein [Synechococcus sp. CS-1324]